MVVISDAIVETLCKASLQTIITQKKEIRNTRISFF